MTDIDVFFSFLKFQLAWVAVPVLDVHATAGELVELACDVSKTRASAGRWGSTGRAKPSRRWRPFESSSRTVWDHVDDEDDDGDDTSQEGEQNGAYLVLWFMDSEHKPVYRWSLLNQLFLFKLAV